MGFASSPTMNPSCPAGGWRCEPSLHAMPSTERQTHRTMKGKAALANGLVAIGFDGRTGRSLVWIARAVTAKCRRRDRSQSRAGAGSQE